jgi:hypothetical protein
MEEPKKKYRRHPFGFLEIIVDSATEEEDARAAQELRERILKAHQERADLGLTDGE